VSTLDADTGEVQNSFRSPARALTSLRIAGDTLYVTGLDGGLFAHDATDGSERFRFAPALAIAGIPEIIGETAYVGTVDGD
jgi:outer membrane protein assembly factor BamB